jgi:hypothetical protein
MTEQRWHRRSYRDGDTHWGRLQENGYVTARCGIVFRPNEQLFSRDVAERDEVPDAIKLCGDCKARPTVDEDIVRVHEVMNALGRGPRGHRRRSTS